MGQKNGKKFFVNEEEFKNASNSEKILINQIDFAVAMLEIVEYENKNYMASITTTMNENNELAFSILLFAYSIKEEIKIHNLRKCILCGPVSGYNCIKLINDYCSLEKHCNIQIRILENKGIMILW